MEGLNKLCLSIYLRPWISKHAWAKFNRGQSVQVQAQDTKNPKPMGDHSHINNGTHRLPHIWPLIFTPYISPKPLFLPKIVTQSPIFFHTVQNFGNFSLKDPKSAGIWEKGTQMPPIFMAFVTERPPIFCLACTCLRGECCSLKHGQKLENFVFLKQNRAIWWILLGAN